MFQVTTRTYLLASTLLLRCLQGAEREEMAGFVRLLLCLTFVPLAMCTISTFDLRGSTSGLRAVRSNFVQKTVPLSALGAELSRIRVRRNHEDQSN